MSEVKDATLAIQGWDVYSEETPKFTPSQKVEMIAQAAVRQLNDYAEYCDRMGIRRARVHCLPCFPEAPDPQTQRFLNYTIAERIKQIAEDMDLRIPALCKFELKPYDEEVPIRRWAADLTFWVWRSARAVTEPLAYEQVQSARRWIATQEHEGELTIDCSLPVIKDGDLRMASPLMKEIYDLMLERDPEPEGSYYQIVPEEVDYRQGVREALERAADGGLSRHPGVLWRITDRGLTVKRLFGKFSRRERLDYARAGWHNTRALPRKWCRCT